MNRRVLLTALVPAVFMACHAAIVTMDLLTVAIAFLIWLVGGLIALIIFCYPLIIIIKKYLKLNLWVCILIATAGAELAIAMLWIIVPPRLSWSTAFINSSLNIFPSQILAGVGLWYIGFKSYKSKSKHL